MPAPGAQPSAKTAPRIWPPEPAGAELADAGSWSGASTRRARNARPCRTARSRTSTPTGRRMLPIHDEAHVRNALARFSRVQLRGRRGARPSADAAPDGRQEARDHAARVRRRPAPAPSKSFRAATSPSCSRTSRARPGCWTGSVTGTAARCSSSAASCVQLCSDAGGREIDARGDEYFGVFALADRRRRRSDRHPARASATMHGRRASTFGSASASTPAGPALTETGYVGLAVHTVARVCTSGHGGQIVISSATRDALTGPLPDGIDAHEPRHLAPQRAAGVDRAPPGRRRRPSCRLPAAPPGRPRRHPIEASGGTSREPSRSRGSWS